MLNKLNKTDARKAFKEINKDIKKELGLYVLQSNLSENTDKRSISIFTAPIMLYTNEDDAQGVKRSFIRLNNTEYLIRDGHITDVEDLASNMPYLKQDINDSIRQTYMNILPLNLYKLQAEEFSIQSETHKYKDNIILFENRYKFNQSSQNIVTFNSSASYTGAKGYYITNLYKPDNKAWDMILTLASGDIWYNTETLEVINKDLEFRGAIDSFRVAVTISQTDALKEDKIVKDIMSQLPQSTKPELKNLLTKQIKYALK